MIISHTVTGEKIVIEDYPDVFVPPWEFEIGFGLPDDPIQEQEYLELKKKYQWYLDDMANLLKKSEG